MSGLYDAPSLLSLKIGTFKGIDVSVPEDQQKPYRAARATNMMPDATGEARKRPGFQFEEAYKFAIGGQIVDMIGGKHPIIYHNNAGFDQTNLFPCWSIYQNVSNTYYLVATTDHKPVVIPSGRKHMIFMANDEYHSGACNLFGHKDAQFLAAFAVIDGDIVTGYTELGDRWVREKLTVTNGRIPPDDSYVTTPTLMQGCIPEGGGSPFQQVNLLNPWVTESFCLRERACVFYLNDQVTVNNERLAGNIISTLFDIEVFVPVTEKEGEEDIEAYRWVKRPLQAADGYRPSANRLFLSKDINTTGGRYTDDVGNTITGINVGTGEAGWIGASHLEGEDNLRITHWRNDFTERFMQICRCVCGTFYGVGGHKDRLFLGGLGEKKNLVYYSELEDPFYIGDLNYIELTDGGSVLEMNGIGSTLAILTDRGTYLAQATAQNTTESTGYVLDAAVKISAKLQTPGVIEGSRSAIFGGEIVYLSPEGVIAVASGDNYDARYAEHRSAMINREMLKDNPKRLISAGRYLLIQCDNDICWVLDEYQPTSDGDRPYSKRQFEGFRLSGVKGDLYENGGAIYSIYNNGRYLWTNGTLERHYHDNWDEIDTAIEAYWETPWLYGNTFYRKKVFMKLGILLGQIAGANTSVKVEARKNDETGWTTLWEPDGTLCTFDFSNLDFRFFTYAKEPGNPDIVRKIKVKKALRVKFRLSNVEFDQPFILQELGLDYVSEN